MHHALWEAWSRNQQVDQDQHRSLQTVHGQSQKAKTLGVRQIRTTSLGVAILGGTRPPKLWRIREARIVNLASNTVGVDREHFFYLAFFGLTSREDHCQCMIIHRSNSSDATAIFIFVGIAILLNFSGDHRIDRMIELQEIRQFCTESIVWSELLNRFYVMATAWIWKQEVHAGLELKSNYNAYPPINLQEASGDTANATFKTCFVLGRPFVPATGTEDTCRRPGQRCPEYQAQTSHDSQG